MQEMRRKDRQISYEESMKLLQEGEYGVLATVDDENQPYGTPLSYIISDSFIYFHCAQAGQKLQNIKLNPRVCFTVVGNVAPVFADGNFSTYFTSVMVFGTVAEVTEHEEKYKSLLTLCEKYFSEHIENAVTSSINSSITRTGVYKISMDRVTGKAKK